jgi:hypothetical protein
MHDLIHNTLPKKRMHYALGCVLGHKEKVGMALVKVYMYMYTYTYTGQKATLIARSSKQWNGPTKYIQKESISTHTRNHTHKLLTNLLLFFSYPWFG